MMSKIQSRLIKSPAVSRLPVELLMIILEKFVEDTYLSWRILRLGLTSRQFWTLIEPLLYRLPYLLTAGQIIHFHQSLLLKPVRASQVKSIGMILDEEYSLFPNATDAIVSIVSLCTPQYMSLHVHLVPSLTVYHQLRQASYPSVEGLHTAGEFYLCSAPETFPSVRYLHLEFTWISMEIVEALDFEMFTSVTHLWLLLPGHQNCFSEQLTNIPHDITMTLLYDPPPLLQLLLLQSVDDGTSPVSWELLERGEIGPNVAIVLTEWDVLSADQGKFVVDLSDDVWEAGEQLVAERCPLQAHHTVSLSESAFRKWATKVLELEKPILYDECCSRSC
ncbi:hypothetical protein GYMLUDRAFT_59386 [Collybiopsis luxurians FD-317 M1]|uniref:F-box domain-containing protein n=1 Tax=Collybiopsis luxurians FD-317 M1 TaxID=944289 RepID=A0A0D0BY36_9AGAR|nr:hypothetical protein GYMLUDRAFT_59386 [Collybiopsis luxurians FD-317 M1]